MQEAERAAKKDAEQVKAQSSASKDVKEPEKQV